MTSPEGEIVNTPKTSDLSRPLKLLALFQLIDVGRAL